MGLGDAIENVKVIETAAAEIAIITGQKPVVTKARKAVANFKLREGVPHRRHGHACGGTGVYPLLDKLIGRSRFPACATSRWFPRRRFDGAATVHTLGIKTDHVSRGEFTTRSRRSAGMNITIVTTGPTDEEGLELLRLMECPSGRKQERRADVGQEIDHRQVETDAEIRRPEIQPVPRCGRPRAFYRKFQLCRICLRQLALRGELPAWTKASW